ncbi:MAG: transposase, partial [Gammaproteobacteria bacterium]
MCARLKNLQKSIKNKILASKTQKVDEHNDSFFFELELASRRLIISYKLERTRKDQNDRERALKSLKINLKNNKNASNLISNYGYKKFIKINEHSEVCLDQEKINQACEWDGLHGLITNLHHLDAMDIYKHYRGLWLIEDAFRINKSDFKIRPIFHWTPHRIKAHIAISYMSYCC